MIAEEMIRIMNNSYYEDLVGKVVQIKRSDKTAYMKLIGMRGVVDRISGTTIGVRINNMNNEASAYGVFWFSRNEIKVLDEERRDMTMMNFKHVAKVKLDDYSKRDYAFALYDHEIAILEALGPNARDALVVVNASNKGNRVLGTISDICTAEDFYADDNNKNINITAEVVGVVDMSGHVAREAEKARQRELAKKKAAIEKELEAEINKRKSIEYYEAMAKEYADNPKLAELVAELKQLGL